MAVLEVRVQRTPNPNALLFHVNRSLTDKKVGETYSSLAAAQASPLAAKLLQVAGVQSVFFLPSSITITRSSGASWDSIAPAVETAIREHYAESAG